MRFNSGIDLWRKVHQLADIEIDVPFSKSDHDSINFSISFLSSRDVSTKNVIDTFLWSKTNWSGFANYCTEFNWVGMFSTCTSSNDCWSAFSSVLNDCRDMFVPKFRANRRSTGNNKSKMTSKTIRKLTANKKRTWKLRRSNSCISNKTEYRYATIKLKQELYNESVRKEHRILVSDNL